MIFGLWQKKIVLLHHKSKKQLYENSIIFSRIVYYY